MGSLIELTDQKFGKLIVLGQWKSFRNSDTAWICDCDCGDQKIVRGRSLRGGETKDCGCGKRLARGEANFRYLCRGLERGAKDRNISFNLSEDFIRDITKRDCFYCGLLPKQISQRTRSYGAYIYNGIDRIDSNLEYYPNNVVSCCKQCNYAKRSYTISEFQEWIKRVYKNFILEEKINEI